MKSKKNEVNFYFFFLFFLQLINRFLFKNKSEGLEEFRKDYGEEYLLEVPEKYHTEFPEFQSCINCSLCDSYCSKLSDLHRDGLPKISELILSSSISIEEYRFSFNEVDIFSDCLECLEPCISVCPNDYPVYDLIKFMAEYNKKLDEI